jgi:acyl-CoA thioesterase FadM
MLPSLNAQVGDSLTATVTVERSSGSRVSFQTRCRSADSGQIVVDGTALALIKPLPPAPEHQQQ